MKFIINTSFLLFLASTLLGQEIKNYLKPHKLNDYEIIRTESHIPGLKIAMIHAEPTIASNDYAILFLHGASFPSSLAFGFKMDNYSWMDNLKEHGYDVFALDFLGYGNSDRYPEMDANLSDGKPVGRALEVYKDVDVAINLILKKTGKTKVYLIGHSWGGYVAALYATKFPDKVEKLILFAAITPLQDSSASLIITHTYETLTPEQRLISMKDLTPEEKVCQLEPEVFKTWGDAWLRSDTLAAKYNSNCVRFPAGPLQDVEDISHNKSYFDPQDIKSPTLILRGEWDMYPNNSDAEQLFSALDNVPFKKYVVIEKGTHVIHLEKSRYQLYDEVLHFLKSGNRPSTSDKHAIAVIFEVIPAEGRKQEYLDIALSLKPELEKVKGFISIERFQSIYHPEKILSLSFWESEQAIEAWRNLEIHRRAQEKGRKYVFKDYHLRIAQVVRDYGMFERKEAPSDSRSYRKQKSN